MPEIYQALVILLDQHSGRPPRISSLLLMQTATQAIEFEYDQLPIRFSPIYYQNPGTNSPSPGGQTIPFGCPLELRTVGELKKIPPVLEYLLDSVGHSWSGHYFGTYVSQKHRNYHIKLTPLQERGMLAFGE
jgi:hypothetical protein